MRPLRAVSLPQVRSTLVDGLRRDAAKSADLAQSFSVALGAAESVRDLWTAEAKALATASLWWVTPDMVTLAADTGLSGDELPAWERDAESRTGLLVWDGGLPVRVVNRSQKVSTIDAVSWMPMPEASQHPSMGGMRVQMWTRAGATKAPLDRLVTTFGAPDDPLVAVGDKLMHPELAVWRVLCATMLLSHEPKVSGTRAANFALDSPARDPRTRDVPDVTVIDLRTVRDWTVTPDDGTPGEGRTYSHRWIVRGHMKTYHVGPRGNQRAEKRWITPYVAGPEGAPLIPKEHVWVWRR